MNARPDESGAGGPGAARDPGASAWIHRVDISELDPYAHANHTAFIRWMEEGRERLLRGRGTSFLALAREGPRPVLANLSVDYRSPANWGDEIEVETRVAKLGRSSVVFAHAMRHRDGREVLRGTATMVFVGGDGKPAPIPEGFRRAFERPDPSGGPERP